MWLRQLGFGEALTWECNRVRNGGTTRFLNVFDGICDEGALKTACLGLEKRHPMLRVMIEDHQGAPWFKACDPSIPMPWQHRHARGMEEVDEVFRHIADDPFEASAPQYRWVLLTEPERQRMSLVGLFSHVIADGRSVIDLGRQAALLLQAVLDDDRHRIATFTPPYPFPPSQEALVDPQPAHAGFFWYAFKSLKAKRPYRPDCEQVTPGETPVLAPYVTAKLTQGAKEQLEARAAQAGVPLATLLVEALFLEQRDEARAQNRDQDGLAVRVPFDMRNIMQDALWKRGDTLCLRAKGLDATLKNLKFSVHDVQTCLQTTIDEQAHREKFNFYIPALTRSGAQSFVDNAKLFGVHSIYSHAGRRNQVAFPSFTLTQIGTMVVTNTYTKYYVTSTYINDTLYIAFNYPGLHLSAETAHKEIASFFEYLGVSDYRLVESFDDMLAPSGMQAQRTPATTANLERL